MRSDLETGYITISALLFAVLAAGFCAPVVADVADDLEGVTMQVMELDETPSNITHVITVPGDVGVDGPSQVPGNANALTAEQNADGKISDDLIPEVRLLKEPPLSIGDGLELDLLTPKDHAAGGALSPESISILGADDVIEGGAAKARKIMPKLDGKGKRLLPPGVPVQDIEPFSIVVDKPAKKINP